MSWRRAGSQEPPASTSPRTPRRNGSGRPAEASSLAECHSTRPQPLTSLNPAAAITIAFTLAGELASIRVADRMSELHTALDTYGRDSAAERLRDQIRACPDREAP